MLRGCFPKHSHGRQTISVDFMPGNLVTPGFFFYFPEELKDVFS